MDNDLKKYYKYVYVCKECRRKFGSDKKSINKRCPICERGYNSFLKKRDISSGELKSFLRKRNNKYLTS